MKKNQEDLMELRSMILEVALQSNNSLQDWFIQSIVEKFLKLQFVLKFINVSRMKSLTEQAKNLESRSHRFAFEKRNREFNSKADNLPSRNCS